MSLRDEIRHTIACKAKYLNHYGKTVVVQKTVNATANLWYRTHYPEPRFMAPSIDIHRSFTKAELLCIA